MRRRHLRRGLAGFALVGATVFAPLPAGVSAHQARMSGSPGLQAWAVDSADRDLLVRAARSSLWQSQAALQALDQGGSGEVVEAAEKIANELSELFGLLRDVANRLGVELPSQPNAEQNEWLLELASAQGEGFDRIFADRIRAENGETFTMIAVVRATTRDDQVRSFASSANDAVLRHMFYLERIEQANPTAPPGPVGDTGVAGEPDGGALARADGELFVRMRTAALWGRAASQQVRERASAVAVSEAAAKIADECDELAEVVRSIAAAVGVAVPDQPAAEQQAWLDEIAAADGEERDRVFVNRLRADHVAVFLAIADIRVATRNNIVRSFANKANGTVMRHMAYLERTGLVDYESLPRPRLPERITGLQRQDGVPSLVIWLMLATAVLLCAVTVARVVRSRVR